MASTTDINSALAQFLTSGSNPTGTAIGQGYDLISALLGTQVKQGQQAAAAADPFASQRGQYQQQLSALLSNPASFQTDPGYEFAKQQGLDAMTAKAGALYGSNRAGALLPELGKYATGYANQAYDARINQLGQLAGANSGSPGTAGGILAGAFNNQDASLASGALGVGSLLDTLFGGGTPGGALSAIGNLFSGSGGSFDTSLLSDPNFWNSLTTGGSSAFGVDPTVAGDLSGVFGFPSGMGGLSPTSSLGDIVNSVLGG